MSWAALDSTLDLTGARETIDTQGVGAGTTLFFITDDVSMDGRSGFQATARIAFEPA